MRCRTGHVLRYDPTKCSSKSTCAAFAGAICTRRSCRRSTGAIAFSGTGRVVAVGDNVADWAAGDRVAVNPNGNVDGSCVYCRSGRQNFCRQATLETALGLQADGALAPLMATFAGHLRRIPDGLGTLEAAWVEPTATALRAVEIAGDLAGRTVLVTGGGPIGQLACRLAHLRSPVQILLMEPAEQRAQLATDCTLCCLPPTRPKPAPAG